MLKTVNISRFCHGRAAYSSTAVTKTNIEMSKFSGVIDSFMAFFVPHASHPPYRHVCQVGDPVLRQTARLVEPAMIQTPKIQKVMSMMRTAMNRYDVLGLSAPQIGESLQIFMLEITEDTVRGTARELIKHFGLLPYVVEPVPFKIFINPKLKVLDRTPITSLEGCASIIGLLAHVQRFKKVQITGLDESGKAVTWIAKDFAACVAQHEFDHLQGQLYTDKMKATTLSHICWKRINSKHGQMRLSFYPTFVGTRNFMATVVKRFFAKLL